MPGSIEIKTLETVEAKNIRPQFNWYWGAPKQEKQSKKRRKSKKSKKQGHAYDYEGDFIQTNSQKLGQDEIMVFGKVRQVDRTCQQPIDDAMEYELSSEYAIGAYSFMDIDTLYDKKAPPPLYIDFSDLNAPKPTAKDDVLASFFVNKKGYLECSDTKVTDSFKGVISYVS